MKRLLLDTHVFLWWLADDARLGEQAANSSWMDVMKLCERSQWLGNLDKTDDGQTQAPTTWMR